MFKLALAAALAACALACLPARAAPAFQPDRFTVETRGAGPDVILIPGLATSRAEFDDLVRRDGGRHRLHLVQLNGFAGAAAGANAEGPILEPLVEALHRYIAAGGLHEPAVIGHSLGGLAGLMLAERHPEDVGRLMIIDALPFYAALAGPQMTPAAAEPMAAQVRDTLLAASPEALEAAETQSAMQLSRTPEGRKTVVAWSLASDRGVMARAFYEDVITDVRPGLAGIRAPTTVLYAYDPAMGPAALVDGLYAGQYAGLTGARLTRIDGSFHFIPLDQPEAFAEAVQAFLR